MKKQSWLTYNDLDVSRTQEAAVQRDRDRSGYIFFYMHKLVFVCWHKFPETICCDTFSVCNRGGFETNPCLWLLTPQRCVWAAVRDGAIRGQWGLRGSEECPAAPVSWLPKLGPSGRTPTTIYTTDPPITVKCFLCSSARFSFILLQVSVVKTLFKAISHSWSFSSSTFSSDFGAQFLFSLKFFLCFSTHFFKST